MGPYGLTEDRDSRWFGVYKAPLTTFSIFNMPTVSPLAPFGANETPADIPGLDYPISGNLALAVANPTLAPQLGLLPAVVGRYVLDPNLRDSYTLMWNFSVERKLANNLMLQLSYVGNHALNAYETGAENMATYPNGVRPDPAIGEIDIVRDDGRRKYNALQVTMQKRLSSGLFADVYYTYSHSDYLWRRRLLQR